VQALRFGYNRAEGLNDTRVAIVWRPVHDLEDDKAVLFADQAFIEQTILPALLGTGVQPDRLLVNGPCFVEGAEAIAPEFKRRMFNGQI